MAKKRRLTVGQAVVEFLTQQHTSFDGVEQPFFGGAFAIFGHGNVAGVGEALHACADRLPCYLPRNEQAMVHCGRRLREDGQSQTCAGVHEFHRSRCDEHADRRCGRDDQSSSSPVTARAIFSRRAGPRPSCSSSNPPPLRTSR